METKNNEKFMYYVKYKIACGGSGEIREIYESGLLTNLKYAKEFFEAIVEDLPYRLRNSDVMKCELIRTLVINGKIEKDRPNRCLEFEDTRDHRCIKRSSFGWSKEWD